jgi:hypothetical protein
MTHTCPACGLLWECKCDEAVKQEHITVFGFHPVEIGCSILCAQQLQALVSFLRRYIK